MSFSSFILFISSQNLFSTSARQKEHFENLSKVSVSKVAKVSSKRTEDVLSQGEWVQLRFVEMEHSLENQTYKLEQQYHGKMSFEEIQIGQPVNIRFDPQHPESFYAPEFLEFQSENFHPTVINYWLYRVLAAFCGLLLLAGFVVILRPSSKSSSAKRT